MVVNIEFALVENRLVHISKRLSKDKQYYCPSCSESVIPRKGTINTHHFAHKQNSTCSATEETMLHFFAKHYLASANGEDIYIQFPIELFNTIRGTMNSLPMSDDVEYIPIKLNHILEFFNVDIANGSVERPIGNFVADVLFNDLYEELYDLVIEVYVTHAVEEQKRQYFIKQDVPYIEVKPTTHNEKIHFLVTDFFLPGFIEMYENEAKEKLVSFAYNELREEMLQKARLELKNYEQIEIQKDLALQELMQEIEKVNLRNYINSSLYKDMISIPASAFRNMDYAEKVNNVQMKGKSLHCNNHYVNFETRILHSLISNFMAEGIQIEALIQKDQLRNNKQIVTGFNFMIPSTQVTGRVMKDILKELISQLESKPF